MAVRKLKKTEQMENKIKLCLLVFLLFVIYLLIGSLIFEALEKVNEKNVTNELSKQLSLFLLQNECIEQRELQILFVNVRTALRGGAYSIALESTDTNSTTEPDLIWNTISGIFFCFTIVTTIGFGHITPKTVEGQVFCIIYASIGIPITGYLLSLLGDNFERFWKWYQCLFNKKFSCIRSVRLRRTAIISFGIVTVLVLTLFLPSYYWSAEEGWSYWTSIYYNFITMTTIGFGDYVASIDDNSIPLFIRIFDLILTIFTILLTLGIVTGIFKIASKRIQKSKDFGASRLSTMIKKLIGNEGINNDELNNMSIKTISNDLAKRKTNGNHNELHVYKGEGSSADDQNCSVQNTHVEDDIEKGRVSDTSQATDLSCADVSVELSNRLELHVNKQLVILKDGLSDEMIADIRDVIKNHILEATESSRNSYPPNIKSTTNGTVNSAFVNDKTQTFADSENKRVYVDMHTDSGLRYQSNSFAV